MLTATAICVVLGLSQWIGAWVAVASLFAANIFVLGHAVYSRRRRLLVWSAVCLALLVSGVLLVRFAPFSAEASMCRVCGKGRGKLIVLGVKVYENVYDTELSRWYQRTGLRPHAHDWAFLSSTERHWDGQEQNTDSLGHLGLDTIALDCFRDASARMDAATFDSVAEDYYATQDDTSKVRAFVERCDRILRGGDSSTGGGGKPENEMRIP
jgi:hypothetical protein